MTDQRCQSDFDFSFVSNNVIVLLMCYVWWDNKGVLKLN